MKELLKWWEWGLAIAIAALVLTAVFWVPDTPDLANEHQKLEKTP